MRMIPIPILVALLMVFGCGPKQVSVPGSPGRGPSAAPGAAGKAVMIIAHKDFRDEELTETRRVLEQANQTVVVASSDLSPATGMLDMQAPVDLLVKDVKAADYDAVVFVGGSGAQEYWDDPAAQQLARDAVAQGKVLGAICFAPVTLANAGVLQGKKATVWRSEVGRLKAQGADYTGAKVQVDGRIVTADGPEAAPEFGKALLKVLAEK
jgi:protease I